MCDYHIFRRTRVGCGDLESTVGAPADRELLYSSCNVALSLSWSAIFDGFCTPHRDATQCTNRYIRLWILGFPSARGELFQSVRIDSLRLAAHPRTAAPVQPTAAAA